MALTDSAHVDRLVRLLMMLPAPDREEHQNFWGKVAEERSYTTDYVTLTIATRLASAVLYQEQASSGPVGLATYALHFFGQPSEELTTYIAASIDRGALSDSNAVGQVWIQCLRETAFAVIEESIPEDRVRKDSTKWIRAYHPGLKKA